MLVGENPELRYRDATGRLLQVLVNPSPELKGQLERRRDVDAVIPARDALWVVSKPA